MNKMESLIELLDKDTRELAPFREAVVDWQRR